MKLFRNVLEDWACGLDDRRGGKEGKAEAKDLSLKPEDLTRVLDVSEHFERLQNTSDGGAGEAYCIGDLNNAAAIALAFKALDNAQSAGERQNEIGITGIWSEFAALAGMNSDGRHSLGNPETGDYRT